MVFVYLFYEWLCLEVCFVCCLTVLWLLILLYAAGLGCFVGFVAFGLICVFLDVENSVQLLGTWFWFCGVGY